MSKIINLLENALVVTLCSFLTVSFIWGAAFIVFLLMFEH